MDYNASGRRNSNAFSGRGEDFHLCFNSWRQLAKSKLRKLQKYLVLILQITLSHSIFPLLGKGEANLCAF
jgi:hypothetical protein